MAPWSSVGGIARTVPATAPNTPAASTHLLLLRCCMHALALSSALALRALAPALPAVAVAIHLKGEGHMGSTLIRGDMFKQGNPNSP